MTASAIQQVLLALKSGTANGTLFTVTLNSDSNGWNSFTGVIRVQASAMTLPSGGITQVRLKLRAGSSEGFTVTNMYIGHRAAAGDAYDFATTPVQVLFGGSASKVIAAGTTEWSDWASFAYNKTDDLLGAFYCAGGSSSDMLRYALSVTGAEKYDKVANDAATVNKTGYSNIAVYVGLIDTIESDGY